MIRKEKDGSKSKLVLVRFKFRGLKEESKEWMTRSQYENLKNVPSIEYCKVIG